MGKTSLATDVIRAQEAPVHFFSAEMTTVEIGMRRFSVETGLPSDRLDGGNLSSDDWDRIISAEKKLGVQKLYVDPTSALTIAQLSTRARRVKRQHDTGLIVVDYLQLLRGTRRENRVVELSEITAGLKAIAKELNVPVLALSQLSRAVEERPDKRPQLSDLRDSGSIEQDADVVMFVFREAYYLERIQTPSLDESARLDAVRNLADIIIAKNRNGPVGGVTVHFDAPTAHFSNLGR
jgi:replicative DNA helicase